MKRLDQVTGSLLLIFSLYYLYEASRMPLMAGKAPGAGWFPLLLGGLMALLSVLLIVSGFRRPASRDTTVTWPRGVGLANNVAILGGLAASVLLLQLLGYLVSTFIFIFGLTLFLGKYHWVLCGVVSLATAAVLYWVFKVWLEIPLPPGMINFLG